MIQGWFAIYKERYCNLISFRAKLVWVSLNHGTPADRKIGMWSPMSVAVLGGIYVCVGGMGVLMRPPGLGALAQVDPYLAILEFLIILSAVALVAMMAAIYRYAPAEKKTCSLIALAFMISFAVLTCSTHFVALTVGRQITPRTMFQFSWPSIVLALDLLAWDFFLGLSLLFAAPVFRGDRQRDTIRIVMYVNAVLCLCGTVAPLSGHMWLQLSAITGYAFVLPVNCVLLARLFARQQP
jgi:hypothetical protein